LSRHGLRGEGGQNEVVAEPGEGMDLVELAKSLHEDEGEQTDRESPQ